MNAIMISSKLMKKLQKKCVKQIALGTNTMCDKSRSDSRTLKGNKEKSN